MDGLLKKLNEIAKEIDILGKEVYPELQGDMRDDFHFMCKSFLKRQLTQLGSLVLLEDRDDVILIARSMFEGSLYLSYSLKDKEMCRRWRLFSCVVDIKRMDKSDDPIPEDVVKIIDSLRPEVDKLFKKENGEYQWNWYGDKSIKKIANLVDSHYLYLYETYYSPMSEYHHWATAAFGKRYRLDGSEVVEMHSDEVKLERSSALCMALSSVFSTLKLGSKVLGGNSCHQEKINALAKKLENLEGTITRKINIKSSIHGNR
ncbi:DUF5677 domain-containing protein [Castellaniella hirudinis]|uniref:DUF5677 domain-containing protein n=1 Tax=Castellaniella hirudinis TaxID=1144617 RepID=A0ABV8S1N7_9BURK